MSTGILSGGLRCSVTRAENLTTFMCRFSTNSTNSGSLNLLEPKGPSRPLMRYLFYYLSNHYCLPLSAGMDYCEVAFVLL